LCFYLRILKKFVYILTDHKHFLWSCAEVLKHLSLVNSAFLALIRCWKYTKREFLSLPVLLELVCIFQISLCSRVDISSKFLHNILSALVQAYLDIFYNWKFKGLAVYRQKETSQYTRFLRQCDPFCMYFVVVCISIKHSWGHLNVEAFLSIPIWSRYLMWSWCWILRFTSQHFWLPRPSLKNLSRGLNLSCGSNMVGSTQNRIQCFKI